MKKLLFIAFFAVSYSVLAQNDIDKSRGRMNASAEFAFSEKSDMVPIDDFIDESEFDDFCSPTDLESAESQYDIGLLYFFGIILSQDFDLAVTYFEKSALQGNGNAQYSLGVCYLYGYGVEQDDSKAVELFSLAAEKKVPEAQFMLGISYILGLGELEVNCFKAYKWLSLADENGCEEAKEYLQYFDSIVLDDSENDPFIYKAL